MMHPMRVQWSEPDEAKRNAARVALERDRRDVRRSPLDPLLAHTNPAERHAALLKMYPDLEATTTQFGTLLCIRYVPEQWGMSVPNPDWGTFSSSVPTRMAEAKWVALVATAHGTVEMDPRTLRVMWPMAGGDPIGGVVSSDELTRQETT